MRYGSLTCTCGQHVYFETARTTINCIKCSKLHDVGMYPFKEEIPEVPEIQEAADIDEVELME